VSRRAGLGLLAAFVVLLAVVGLLAGRPVGDRPTVRSARPAGLLAAFSYLDRRGYPVERWERPLDELPLHERHTLVIGAPFTVVPGTERVEHLSRWLSAGGRLVLLTSGRRPAAPERLLYAGLQLSVQDLGARPPLSWSAWRRWRTQPRRLRASERRVAATVYPDRALAAAQSTHVVTPGRDAEVLYEDEDGTPAVFREPHGRGSLLVVNDASVLANLNVDEAANVDFLEALASSATGAGADGSRIYFCEWLHGFRAVEVDSEGHAGALVWLGLHALLIYALSLWRLGRRFGPPPREVRVPESSIGRDLSALASLHERAGHTQDAGTRLLELARRGRPAGARGDTLPERFDGGPREFVELARRVARAQRKGEL
jgi:hypothetical protein